MARQRLTPTGRFGVNRFPTVPTPPVDPKRYELALAFSRRFNLAAHSARIAGLLQMLQRTHPLNQSPDVVRLRHQLIAAVEAVVPFHVDEPFPVVPRKALTGPIIVGLQKANGEKIGFPRLPFSRHVGINGPSGSGKTTVLLQLAQQLHPDPRLAILDGKNDFDHFLLDDRVLIIDGRTKWTLLIPPSWLPVEEYDDELVDLFLACTYGAQLQRELLTNGLRAARERSACPSMADWRDAILSTPRRESFSRGEKRQGAAARLERLRHFALFAAHEESLTWDDLYDHTVIVRARQVDEIMLFLFTLMVRMFFLRNRLTGVRNDLTHVVIIDEAYQVLSKRQDGITSVHPLLLLIQQVREFSIGVLYTSTSIREIDPLIRSSTFFLFALAPSSYQEAREVINTFGLSTEEAEYYTRRMPRGEALLKCDWPTAIHLRIPAWPHSKTISDADITAAEERTNRLARRRASEATPRDIIGPPTEVQRKEPARLLKSESPQAASIIVSAPPAVSEPQGRDESNRRDALTAIELRVIDYIATNGVVLTTECQRDLHLHPQQIARAKAKLLTLGAITEQAIRCRPHRGGNGVALALTTNGASFATQKPARVTRGNDSVQHAFLATRIARALPNAQVEISLNGKSIDVVVAYQTADHAPLINALRQPIAVNDGDLLAIEVELSPKNLRNNVVKNASVGVAFNIIAILPNMRAAAQRAISRLSPDLRQHVLLVDALELLDALEKS